jgi:hypothetical protein
MSDGRAGIERQAVSLARALQASPAWASLQGFRGEAGRDAPMRLSPTGWQVRLPPQLWPAPLSALSPDERAQLAPPWPDLLIANGRRSIAYSLLVKRRSAGVTMVVQVQHPRVDASRFDLVVPPEHDGLAGPNVFSILGPPTWWSEAEIAGARTRFSSLESGAGLKALVSIGGDSRTHRLTRARLEALESGLRAIARDGTTAWITVSRRTPEFARESLRRLAGQLDALFWESEARDGPNPYLAFLSMCDVALVTEDSANMLADPAFFGKPTLLLKLEGASPRFDRLHAGFIARGSARWFEGRLETWTYKPIREAERAAAEIARRLSRHRDRLARPDR